MPDIIISGGIPSHAAHWDMGFHEHPSIEISVVLEGTGVMEYSGQTYSIEAGYVVIIPGGLPHRFASTTPIRFGVLQADHLPEALQARFNRLTGADHPSFVALTSIELEMYESLFRSWLKFTSQSLIEPQECNRAWLDLLLLYLLQHANRADRPVTVTSAAEYIRGNLRQEVRIAELARLAGLSVSAFRSAFTAAYGMSPKQYQQELRLSEAKWLLRSSGKAITQIAEQIGLSGVHSFSRWFMDRVGQSPSEWRKAQKGHE